MVGTLLRATVALTVLYKISTISSHLATGMVDLRPEGATRPFGIAKFPGSHLPSQPVSLGEEENLHSKQASTSFLLSCHLGKLVLFSFFKQGPK